MPGRFGSPPRITSINARDPITRGVDNSSLSRFEEANNQVALLLVFLILRGRPPFAPLALAASILAFERALPPTLPPLLPMVARYSRTLLGMDTDADIDTHPIPKAAKGQAVFLGRPRLLSVAL